MSWFYTLLTHRQFIWILLIINIFGTIYGYIWYGVQLSETPLHFIPFVPDSPTASLFFVFVLIAFLIGRNFKLMEALALITLVKYGFWAVVMNILTLWETGYLPWEGYMLIASHGAMAIQAILYSPFFRFRWTHLAIAAIWTVHNDFIDYVFGMMPWYGSLAKYMQPIGYFTFWLSVLCIFLAYYLVVRKDSKELQLN